MLTPKEPAKFIFEIIVFLLLLVPGVLWATLQKYFTAKQKCVKGQVVLITGSARGLGRDLALRFSRLGAKVACVDIDEPGNKDTAQMILDEGGIVTSYTCDVSNRDEIKIMHGRVKEDLGLVDILINNAGIVWGCSLIDPARDQFIIDQINVNFMSHIWMTREILPSMIERNRGHIVAMSSMASRSGIAGISIYTASKWAINGLMESLHNELKLFNSDVKTSTIVGTFVKNDPKITARLRLRFPEMPMSVAGDVMVKGILEEQRMISVPGYMLTIVEYLRLLPYNLQSLFSEICYRELIPDPPSQKILNLMSIKKPNIECYINM